MPPAHGAKDAPTEEELPEWVTFNADPAFAEFTFEPALAPLGTWTLQVYAIDDSDDVSEPASIVISLQVGDGGAQS
jgi:hypothetical protein